MTARGSREHFLLSQVNLGLESASKGIAKDRLQSCCFCGNACTVQVKGKMKRLPRTILGTKLAGFRTWMCCCPPLLLGTAMHVLLPFFPHLCPLCIFVVESILPHMILIPMFLGRETPIALAGLLARPFQGASRYDPFRGTGNKGPRNGNLSCPSGKWQLNIWDLLMLTRMCW